MEKIENYFYRFINTVIPLMILGMAVAFFSSVIKNISTFDDDDMKALLVGLNSELPINTGTIGTQDSITYENKTLTYNHTVNGGDKIKDFYQNHYEDIKELIKYTIVTMNGNYPHGEKLAECFYMKRLNICVRIYTGLDEPVSWSIKGSELKEFVDSCKANPTEALKNTIDVTLQLSNMSLPITPEEVSESDNMFAKCVTGGLDLAYLPQSIERDGNTIVLTISVDENVYNLATIRENTKYNDDIENLAEIISKDEGMKVFLGLLTLSHLNFTFKYIGRQSNDSALVDIPNTILRKYCSVPHELLSNY